MDVSKQELFARSQWNGGEKKLAANKRGSVSMKNNGKCKTRESGEEISGGEDELSRNGWAGPEKEICY